MTPIDQQAESDVHLFFTAARDEKPGTCLDGRGPCHCPAETRADRDAFYEATLTDDVPRQEKEPRK